MWPPILRTFIMLRDLPDPGMDLDLAPMEELIRKVDSPNIFSEKPPVNWATVWMVGEWLRIREGLSPYSKADMDAWLAPFFEQNLEMNHGFNKELAESIGRPIDWTTAIDMEHGFFREPGVPNSYDMFSRVHLLELLVDGYDGAFAAQMHDLLATGMKRSLGVQLSSGSLASAYRSSAHLWNLTGQTYYFYHGSRLLADRNPDLSAKAEAACKRAFRACQTCQRESGDLSPVENVHPLGWRVGYEVYTMEAHYVAMPLGFLGAAIVDGFDGVVSPFAGYDPLGIADITLGVGRRLRFGGQTHYGRGDAHPDAHKLSNQLPFTLGLALRDPDRSIHPVSALQPTGARGAEASADGLTAFAETERGRYSIRIAIAHNELKLVEELGDAARSLMVPYLRDRGDGCQTEVTRSGNGLRLQSGSEIIDIVVGLAQEEQVEISFVTQLEPIEIPLVDDLIERFEAENPNITVNFNHVAYDQILQSLPLQLETGEAPDLLRSTYFQFAPHFLDLSPYVDVDYWMSNMGSTQDLLAAGGEPHPVGVFTNVTVTGGFINRTLFDQAGVEVPEGGSTWEEWAEAARQVAEATGTIAMGLDRTGHRLTAPAINMGASYFDEQGNPQLADDPGFAAWIESMVEWNRDGTMSPDVWVSGSRDPRDDFINGELVLYYSGNWQIGTFAEQIGDRFDWQAILGPCGDGGCSGMPGGGILVGYAGTDHPEAVAKFIDFFAREDNYRQWAEQTLNLIQHAGLVEEGLNFDTTPQAAAALQEYSQIIDQVSPIANNVLISPVAATIFTTTRDRLTQAITGELSVEEAIDRMQQDVDAAVEANN
eukprot:jgi/Tetstr1/451936/TSEL_038972.t1